MKLKSKDMFAFEHTEYVAAFGIIERRDQNNNFRFFRIFIITILSLITWDYYMDLIFFSKFIKFLRRLWYKKSVIYLSLNLNCWVFLNIKDLHLKTKDC